MRISDWSSDVCSSDLHQARLSPRFRAHSPPFPRDCVAEHAGSPPASPEHAADHAHVSGPRRRTRQGRDRREARSRSSRSAAQQVFSLNKFTKLIRDEIRAGVAPDDILAAMARSEEHTSELQSLMRISSAVFCLKKKQTDIG